MTTGDQDPAFGQPSGFPPPTNDPYAVPPGSSYPTPPGYAAPPPGYAPPPQPGFGPPPGYLPPPPPAPYQPMTNPYGAPGGTYPGGPPVGYGQPGRLWPRWGARLIDGILVGIVAGVISAIFGVSDSIMATGFFTGALMFAYFVAMEVTQGRTLGKMLLGMTVRGPGGAPKPDFKQSAIRNAWTLLPIVPYVGGLLGVIAIIWIAVSIENSPTKQGKHDEMAGGTQVLKTK